MRFLLITQYYPPEPGSASIKMAELAEHLARKGHKTTVITGFPNYPYGKIYNGYKVKIFQKDHIKGVQIIRVPLWMPKKRDHFLDRILNHVSFMLTAIYGGLLSKRPDVIYFYSPPLFIGFSAWILSTIFKAPTIAEMNDLWPDAPIALGIIKNKNMIELAYYFEKFIYKKTNHLFFYSETMRQKITSEGIPEKKTEIHHLWVDTKEFSLSTIEKRTEIKKEYGLEEKFIVMYAGYIGLPQGLDILIDVAQKLNEYRDIVFVLVGDGPEKEKIAKRAKDKQLQQIKFLSYQPKEKIPNFLSTADILFVHLASAPHRLGTIPAKILAYMSMGKPVIVAAEGEAACLVTKSKSGVAIKPNDADAISKNILEFYKDNNLGAAIGKTARDYVVSFFDKNKVLESLEKRLVEIGS